MNSEKRSVELKSFPLNLRYWVEEYEYSYRITVVMSYTEVEAVRTALIEAMTHEINECLYVDGDRIFDPHVPEKLHD
jgi:hypothetical protein